MLTAIYTSDIKGSIVVPFVDHSKEAVLSLLDGADGASKLYVWRWMSDLLPAERIVVIDEATDWLGIAADATQHYVFFDESLADFATGFCEILLDDEDVLDSGTKGPTIDMRSMAFESLQLKNGCRLQYWRRLREDDFEAVDVDLGYES